MSTAVLEARGITKVFGGFTALQDVDLLVGAGERVGLIGPNGSGKSTFVNCITGVLQPDGGTVVFRGNKLDGMKAWQRTRTGIARSFQLPRPFRTMTVRENLEVAMRFASNERSRATRAEHAMSVLADVGLAHHADTLPTSLTQVELRKLELARALAAKPQLLVADESMAGLSDSEVDEVLELLMRVNGLGISVILIEHIMRAVMNFSQRVAVLVAGRKIFEGLPAEVLAHPEVERAYLGQ